jgi:hypothetical protein
MKVVFYVSALHTTTCATTKRMTGKRSLRLAGALDASANVGTSRAAATAQPFVSLAA